MKWLLWSVALVVAVAAIVTIIGWWLPVKHEASRTVEFARPADEVYALVVDVKNYPAWWKDTSKVDMLVDEPNRTTFRQFMSTGPLTMTVTERTPPTRFMTKIDDPDQPFGGTWTWEIAPTASGGSRLTVTERGEVYNPIFRFMSRFIFGYTATMDSCLAAMQQKLR